MPESSSGTDDTLDHPNRQAIHDILQDTPGRTKNDMRRRLNINAETFNHHYQILENNDVVTTEESHRKNEHLCFIKGDEELLDDANTSILYGHPATRNNALVVHENPGCTMQQVAEILDVCPSAPRHHLLTLVDNDLIERETVDRSHRFYPTEKLQDWVHKTGRHFERPWEQD